MAVIRTKKPTSASKAAKPAQAKPVQAKTRTPKTVTPPMAVVTIEDLDEAGGSPKPVLSAAFNPPGMISRTDSVDSNNETTLSGAIMKIRELVEHVAETTGMKKTQVKEIIEATLQRIGAALEKGDTLHLPPLGKLKVSKSRALNQGAVITVKIKRGPAEKGTQNSVTGALADEDEDS